MTKRYDPRCDARADRALKRLAAAELEVAKALVPLHATRSFDRDGCASLGRQARQPVKFDSQYAARRGVDAR